MERLITELTSREIWLLRILADPKGWLEDADSDALADYEDHFSGTFQSFLDRHVIKNDELVRASVRSGIDELTMRGLVGLWEDGTQFASGLFSTKATDLGWELIEYLDHVEA